MPVEIKVKSEGLTKLVDAANAMADAIGALEEAHDLRGHVAPDLLDVAIAARKRFVRLKRGWLWGAS